VKKKDPGNRAFLAVGAEERIRTSTILRSPAPQAGASAVPPLPQLRGSIVGDLVTS
jgi:hypothetical protein